MNLPCYYHSTTATRMSRLLAVLGGPEHVAGSAHFPSHSAFVAAAGCADESRGEFSDCQAQLRPKSLDRLDPAAPHLGTPWEHLDILSKVAAGDDGNRHSSQGTSQSRTRGWDVAFVALNFYDLPQDMGGDTCIGCKRGPRCKHI